MKILSKLQVVKLHEELIRSFGGSYGIRDEGLLESSLVAPFQTFGGKELVPSIQQKASKLCYGLVNNHPFIDGNKRLGAHEC